VLTDGIVYHFHSDLEAPNKMDEKPVLVLNLDDFDEGIVSELKKFTNAAFDVEQILSSASELKYRREIINLIAAEFVNPTETFVRHFAGQVYSRRFTQSVIEEFTEITKQAFRSSVNRKIEDRLKSALDNESTQLAQEEATQTTDDSKQEAISDDGIVTSQEEIDGYLVVKAILREAIDPKRVAMRDVRSYCGILLDDNNRKPICRLRFNTSQKHLGLIDENKNEEMVPIDDVDDIFKYADRLKATVAFYANS
jgi:hypothetical protein